MNSFVSFYSPSAILKHLKAGTECVCSEVFETCMSGKNFMLAYIYSKFPYCLNHIYPYMECLYPYMDMWAGMKF